LSDKTLYGNDNAENKLAAQKFVEAYDSLNEAINNSNNGADSNSNNNTNKAPQTGDTTHTAALIFLVIASGIAIIGLSVKKKED
jgi:LPXTG-motif cell wall-anchored protein